MNRSRFLLVHGAWHGAWAWDRVAPELERRQASVHRVDLPSAGAGGDLAADVTAVRAALDQLSGGGPVTLVGHSYGGFVITAASVGRTDIAELVYLCAFQPDIGESLLSLIGGVLPTWAAMDDTSSTVLDPIAAFYADVDQEVAVAASKRLRPQSLKSFRDPVTRAGWRDVASTYIACTQDMAIPYETQQTMSQRATQVLTMESSHSPFLSRPQELAQLLLG